jgi:two-component system, NarL family, sensor kinase
VPPSQDPGSAVFVQWAYIRALPDQEMPSPGMIRSLATACLLVLLAPLSAQDLPAGQAGVDSVLAMRDDTLKVRQLSDLCFAYRRMDGDSALFFGNAALQLAIKLKDTKGQAQAYNDMAIIHMDRSAFSTADSLLRRSLRIREALEDSAGMGAVYNKLGNIFQAQFKLEEALAENFRALRIFERIGPPAKEALILSNIAILQFNLGRGEAALGTHQRAADLRRSIGDARGLAESQGNMANVYAQLGDTTEAITLYEQAIAYFREKELKAELAIQLNNLAGVVMAQGRYDQAAAMYKEALAIREGIGAPKAVASSLIGLGGTYVRQGRMAEAKHLLLRALRMSEELGVRNERMQALLDLARLHARLNAGDSSFHYHQRYVALRDSVFNEDLQVRMAELETRYGTERKEREIQRQRADLAEKDLEIAELGTRAERRRFWLAAAIGGIAVVTISALLFSQVQRRRARALRDAAIIQEREAGLKAVFTATEVERARIARELHDGVGQQLGGLKHRLEVLKDRAPLQDVIGIVDETSREVRDLAHQMMPKALLRLGLAPALEELVQRTFKDTPTHATVEHYGVDDAIPAELATGVYRIAQELLNNVLKHAQATQVEVQLLRNRDHLVLLVQDDGRGFGHTANLPTGPAGGTGIGLLNITDRSRALGGTFELEGAPSGTLATVRVPLDPSLA